VTSKVFSSAHFFCAFACSSRSVSRRAVAIVGVRPETRAPKWRRRAIETLYPTAAERDGFQERSLLGIAGNSTSRSATNLNLGSSPFRRAPVWSLTRGGCPCTAWKHVSGVRGATRG
jgi:hypothetical protein